MVLNKRDLELFVKLQSYGLLTTRLIGLLAFGGIAATTILRRLRKLEKDDYIRRVMRLEGQEILWALTVKGVAEVGDLPIKRNIRSDTLDHDLKLTDLRLKLEDNGIAQSWIPEHEIRSIMARKHGLRRIQERAVPDGLMGVNVAEMKQSVAIELELNFKNSRRYYLNFRNYRERVNLWGIWYVVSSKSLGRTVANAWDNAGTYYGSHKVFLWSLYDEVMSDPANARYFRGGKYGKLSDLFSPKIPARPPALRVSKPDESLEGEVIELNTDKEKEILAPAS